MGRFSLLFTSVPPTTLPLLAEPSFSCATTHVRKYGELSVVLGRSANNHTKRGTWITSNAVRVRRLELRAKKSCGSWRSCCPLDSSLFFSRVSAPDVVCESGLDFGGEARPSEPCRDPAAPKFRGLFSAADCCNHDEIKSVSALFASVRFGLVWLSNK